MKKKSFTLIEILVGLIIISILASLSIASFRKTVDLNQEKACIENLKVLQAAIDIYTLENDALPSTLAQLTPRQIYLAHSQAAGKTKENHLIVALKNIFGIKPALAQSLNYGNNRNVFRCPSQPNASTPAADSCTVPLCPGGGSVTCSSYIFNFTPGITYDCATKRLIKTSTSAFVFDDSPRHRGRALGIAPGGRIGKVLGGIVNSL